MAEEPLAIVVYVKLMRCYNHSKVQTTHTPKASPNVFLPKILRLFAYLV